MRQMMLLSGLQYFDFALRNRNAIISIGNGNPPLSSNLNKQLIGTYGVLIQ